MELAEKVTNRQAALANERPKLKARRANFGKVR